MPRTARRNEMPIFTLQISFSQEEGFSRSYSGSRMRGLLTLKEK